MTDFDRANDLLTIENYELRADNERLTMLHDNAKHWEAQWLAENARLRAALQRIDGINDNPAVYNPMIEEVLRAVLEPMP